MKRKTILITAGPTREKIDPVRFISNYSTGTFGYEIAREARKRGYKVILVSGPGSLGAPSGIRTIRVESACDMKKAVMKNIRKAGCLIMASAVSDWRVKRPSGGKIKRRGGRISLELIQNPDILKEAAGFKKDRIFVGFALETKGLVKNALKKLKEKKLDFIVANRLGRDRAIFGDNKTDVIIMDSCGAKTRLRRKSKKELAQIVLDKVEEFNI